jgi:hypothetical protein
MNRHLIAKWTDERGDNVVSGIVRGYAPLVLTSVYCGDTVQIPDGADVFRPHRPAMEFVAKAGDLK